MDGIKPTLSDLNDDQTPVYDAVKVDLLHPSGPTSVDPTVAVPQPSRVAPITPPFHAAPESNVEIVQNTPPAPTPAPLPVIPERKPDIVPAAAAIHDTAPAAPVVTEPTVVTPYTAPGAKSGRGKGLPIALIVLLLLAAAGGAYYYFIYSKKPVVQAPAILPVTAGTPSSLVQQTPKGTLTTGATTSVTPTLGASLTTTANTGSVALEVEVEPLATPFTGTPTATGSSVTANGSTLHLTATPTKLADGSYHWQARTQVGTSTSAWVTNSLTTSAGADFIISTVAPAAPTVTAVAGGSVSGTTITTSQNQPLISGKSVAGSTVAIVVTPDNITLTPTVAADGSWTVTPSQQLANGNHTLALTTTDSAGNKSSASYSLAVNPVVAATTPTTPAATTPAATTPAATTPTTTTPVTTKLAPTGDPTQTMSLIAFVAGLLAVVGIVFLRRFDRHERG